MPGLLRAKFLIVCCAYLARAAAERLEVGHRSARPCGSAGRAVRRPARDLLVGRRDSQMRRAVVSASVAVAISWLASRAGAVTTHLAPRRAV